MLAGLRVKGKDSDKYQSLIDKEKESKADATKSNPPE